MPLLNRGQSIRTMAGTVPKMKAYAPTREGEPSKGKARGNYVPVYVALGFIALSVTLGLHLAKQQFMHSPAVRLKKSRRETVPEVVEPEHVAQESRDFINKSFFRKVANVQESDNPIDDPIHGNPLTKEPRVESLKTVGVNPADRQ
ncbi:hypothetical protein BVRB_5g126900 [Beta vulgaris subsp. vulgaris]|uniref:Transmembrane protein n=2 Tax=Beta vulgaris subsp. vulgaris TaxID=3555 RepID=A0A0J8BBQ9_BETVV|nr:hypothetical protein BVRB_5g126900 [Beta vulgaris subsp. vulgaris]